jgi:signal transduction histidine kinase
MPPWPLWQKANRRGFQIDSGASQPSCWRVLSLFKSWRFGLGFLAFVVAGSLLLLAWMRQREREESSRLFHALAQADAEFVRRLNLPRSAKLAGDLEQLLGMRIEFVAPGTLKAGSEDVVVAALDDKHDMVFTRAPVASKLSLRDAATRNAFIAFWVVSGLLGWIFARERTKRAESERLAMLGRVATSLAHDIKNPLASIELHAQLITPQDGEDARALQMIRAESGVIGGLVNQWLHLANPLPPKLSKIDAAECLRAVLSQLEAQAAHAGVTVDLSVKSPIWIMGDAQRLAQVFRNLIVNAMQAMPRGGCLRIGAQTSESTVVLSFADQGPGFSETALARGAEMFFTEKEGGMGLGLNIVSSIVKAHGGYLKLQNDPKGGALVLVSFPSLQP